ncbi:YbcC family protein [Acidithiobacillus sulfuriphilus]|uniref:YbcC family protein n=1 Tax=Acidithiobacillus sulfuriphilus TaxID=1867749 RepID=UPI003F63617E
MSSTITASPEQVFDRVIRRIAPVWPLDSFVAVNPYWGFADQSFPEAAAILQGTAGERVLMDRRWYAEQIQPSKLSMADILQAAGDLGLSTDEEEWREYLRQAPEPALRLPTLPELLDRQGHPAISQFVVEQISRFMAAYYDHGQALWSFPKASGAGLYETWRQYTLKDRSLAPMGFKAIRPILLSLSPDSVIARDWAVRILDIPKAAEEAYFLVLLKSVGGWASWCRYLLWQAEMQGGSDADLSDLLTIRMVWEALLQQTARAQVLERWRQQLRGWILADKKADLDDALRGEALLRASEIVFRRQVASRIRHQPVRKHRAGVGPKVQAAFCIDVRSEVYRRHLESVMPSCETIGFAGFFGVLLDYRRQGDLTPRTQSPVLLNPVVHVEEKGPEPVIQRRFRRLRRGAEWKQFKLSAASCFSFVETAGLSYVGRLLADTLGWHRPSVPPDDAGLTAAERSQLQCALPASMGRDERVAMAEFILTGLGLTQGIAPIVLLGGHGSSTTNNPHRAGLDCGACAGQTGEVNAKAAAGLLNDPQVRQDLVAKGWDLDPHSRFLPALHDTMTDRVEILAGLDDSKVDSQALAELREALEKATNLTRLERILRLESDLRDPQVVARNTRFRGRDWSQVRPEWALAGNAAFIAAPRWRTREMNLAGRAFLHDYDVAKDPDFGVLTLIMTAPLVVANWINLQYYGSTVDNQRQGCGNKVLHNVVGGTIGVLEGNGGDLRIGLSEQSIRDSNGGLQHEPLRLSAFIEAPTDAMDRIIAGNEVLGNLVEHRWLSILQIDTDGKLFERRAAGQWISV